MAARILVTGGCGFIGANLVVALNRQGADVSILDIREAHPLLGGFAGAMHRADVGEVDDDFVHGFDAVLHQAACTDTTVTDGAEMRERNVVPFRRLLSIAARTGTDLVYASSAAVYGNSPVPHRVGAGERPLNAYGESKLEMDEIARASIADGSPSKIIGLRYFNVFGRGEDHKAHMASMITKLSFDMRAGRRPRLFRDGEQRRDHVYVADVVAANLRALAAPRASSGIYNVGTGNAVSFNEVVATLNATLGTHLEAEYIENPHRGYQDHTQADLTEARAVLGYQPAYDVVSAVRDYLAAP